jgi:hypothetical protein
MRAFKIIATIALFGSYFGSYVRFHPCAEIFGCTAVLIVIVAFVHGRKITP